MRIREGAVARFAGEASGDRSRTSHMRDIIRNPVYRPSHRATDC